MSEKTNNRKKAIQDAISSLMEKVLNRVLYQDPFKIDLHRATKPLYAALVPDEIFKGSHFERRFVTPFGGVWEALAVAAARVGRGHAERSYMIKGNVREERLRRISETLNRLEHGRRGSKRIRPNWNSELEYILEGKGKDIPVSVMADIYTIDKKSNERLAFEIKAPLPNSDQTKVSKEKILKLHCMEPLQVDGAFYALPYNPFGKRENYNWSFPGRWFNMQDDYVVLIGDEFWEKIGGVGTYRSFIDAVNEIGVEYRERIYREYLGMVPPEGFDKIQL